MPGKPIGRLVGWERSPDTAPHSDPLLLNEAYGIKRAHFKQSNPHMHRHVRLGAAREFPAGGCRTGFMEA